MNAFPASLQLANGATLSLDPSRLALALNDVQPYENVQTLVADRGLALEMGDDPEAPLSGPTLFWLSEPAGAPIAQATFEALQAAAGPLLAWLGPVYHLDGAPARYGLACPLPNVLMVRPAAAQDDAALAQLLSAVEALGLVEAAQVSAALPGVRYFVRPGAGAEPIFAARASLLTDLAGLLEDVGLDFVPMAKGLQGPRTYLADPPLNPLNQDYLRFARVLEARTLLRPGDRSPDVAVLDTGVELSHPDLELFSTGRNFDPPIPGFAVIPDGGPTKAWRKAESADNFVLVPQHHGTCAAGVIGMVRDNGKGGWGVAADARILPVALTIPQVPFSAIAAALRFARDSGVRVISISSGWDPLVQLIAGELDKALEDVAKDCVICAAAGNSRLDGQFREVAYPACHPAVMACAALDNDPDPLIAVDRWLGSNHGPQLSIAAPMHDLATTTLLGQGDGGSDYRVFPIGATSYATPVVSGVAALLLARYPHLTPQQVRAVLERTADRIGAEPYLETRAHGPHNDWLGFGVVDAWCALDFADVRIAHYAGDDGAEPTPTFHDVLESCDIVVSTVDFADPAAAFASPPNSFSGGVALGAANFIYVRATNDGPAAARNVVVSIRVASHAMAPFELGDYRVIDLAHLELPSSPERVSQLEAGGSAVFKFTLSQALATVLAGQQALGAKFTLLAEVVCDNDYAHPKLDLSGVSLERRYNNFARRDLDVAPLFLGKPEEAGPEPREGPPARVLTKLQAFRALDMLNLEIELENLRLEPAEAPTSLVRIAPDEPARLIVHFAPQALAEEAFFGAASPIDAHAPPDQPPAAPLPASAPTPSLPAQRRIAGPSRLVFRMPDATAALPLSVEGLLDWTSLEPELSPRAASPSAAAAERPGAGIAPPAPRETSIEFPYRLVLSPNEQATWRHRTSPATHHGRTELWHSRLAPRGELATSDEYQALRAIWSPDYHASPGPAPEPTPFVSSLSAEDRHQLVRLTSDFGIVLRRLMHQAGIEQWYDPAPIEADELMLSALGAWAHLRGGWELPEAVREREGLALEEWRHDATQGRDHYVRVVYAGFLWPTCHQASLVKITERKIRTIAGQPVAVLLQRFQVLVRQPERGYAPAAYEHAGRENPFRASIRIHTVATPDIDPPAPVAGAEAFWILQGGRPFRFACTGEDPEGRSVDFQMGAMFVPSTDLPGKIGAVGAAHESADPAWRACDVGGRPMALAPHFAADRRQGTTVEVASLELLGRAGWTPDEATRFAPVLGEASVSLPAVEQMVGGLGPTRIRLGDAFLHAAENLGGVFAEMVAPPAFAVPAECAGGLATPNLSITGLSERLGPVGGEVQDLATGVFNPGKFFDASAKLLGGVKLSDILEVVFDDGQFPKLRRDGETVTYTFQPKVKAAGPFQIPPGRQAALKVDVSIAPAAAGGPPSRKVTGELTDFQLSLADIIEVDFDRLHFSRRDDAPLDLGADVAGIAFKGPLAFVNSLREAIPAGLFGDGLKLDVQPKGVSAGFSLALPPIEVGVIAIKDAALSASLFLPFQQDQARLRFAFCERHRPFQVAVTVFGGGGFFALGVGMDGVEIIEAALEFGGAFSLNLGVASGSVEVMAGIYFKWESTQNTDRVEITGYLRMGGCVQVLGVVTISVTFYLALSYQDPKVRGEATLTVKVEVLMFSTSVSLSVEHSFSGSAGDPDFAQLADPGDWTEYATAFA